MTNISDSDNQELIENYDLSDVQCNINAIVKGYVGKPNTADNRLSMLTELTNINMTPKFKDIESQSNEISDGTEDSIELAKRADARTKITVLEMIKANKFASILSMFINANMHDQDLILRTAMDYEFNVRLLPDSEAIDHAKLEADRTIRRYNEFSISITEIPKFFMDKPLTL